MGFFDCFGGEDALQAMQGQRMIQLICASRSKDLLPERSFQSSVNQDSIKPGLLSKNKNFYIFNPFEKILNNV
jgi:hypothetical protein